jgi:C1A family cysteine protease
VKGLGYKPDKPDTRDSRFAVRLGTLAESPPPASASVKNTDVGPKNQSQTSSCTGQATSQAVRLAYLWSGNDCPELSALFAYYMGRAEYGGETSDDGSYLRTVIKGVTQLGIPDEQAWPFADERVNRHPNYAAYRAAYDRKGVRGYHRIDPGDVDGVRRAIASGYPVVGGWQIDEGFLNWNGGPVISGQVMPIGGHALPVVAYGADGTFELLNSWGPGWGRSGYAVVDDMFIAAGQDLWAVEVVP